MNLVTWPPCGAEGGQPVPFAGGGGERQGSCQSGLQFGPCLGELLQGPRPGREGVLRGALWVG